MGHHRTLHGEQEMKRKRLIHTLAVAFFVGFAAIAALAQPQVNGFTPVAGQSVTLLPDGNLLLVGGFGPDGRPLADVVVFDVQRNEPRSHATLSFPRSWHTATVLPDGTVLILGGIWGGGQGGGGGGELFTFSSNMSIACS